MTDCIDNEEKGGSLLFSCSLCYISRYFNGTLNTSLMEVGRGKGEKLEEQYRKR